MTYDYNEHIAQLQEQRDSVAKELREYRNDQESRYRESQLREKWTPSGVNRESFVNKEDRDTYEEIGEIQERHERRIEQIKNLHVHVPTYSVGKSSNKLTVWDICILALSIAFAVFVFRSFTGV